MLTLSATAERVRSERPAYRPFHVAVSRITRLSPAFVRVTFAGEQLETFGSAGLDQRIKLILPLEGEDAPRGFAHLGLDAAAPTADATAAAANGMDWYERWRAQPEGSRNPFRTYTVRAIRQQERELDVDFAVHGVDGPASRWVQRAVPGDELVVVGPDDLSTGWRIGLDWKPGDAREALIVGDETAMPAVCAILEQLPEEVSATAFIEVPSAADVLDVEPRSVHHRLSWIARGGGERGRALETAVCDWVRANASAVAAVAPQPAELDESDVTAGQLWDSPEAQQGPDHGRFYAWIAGETAAVVRLRRFLVTEIGVDRKRVAFMGYWRQGAAELS